MQNEKYSTLVKGCVNSFSSGILCLRIALTFLAKLNAPRIILYRFVSKLINYAVTFSFERKHILSLYSVLKKAKANIIRYQQAV